MKKFILVSFVTFVMLFSSISFGATINSIELDGLNEEQRAQLAVQAAAFKKAGDVTSLSNPEKVSEWVQIGSNVGTALISAAERLGIAADKFLDSKTGKITVFLIIWKVMGSALVHIIGGVIFWIVTTSILFWIWRKSRIDSLTYTAVPGAWFRTKEIKYKHQSEMEDLNVVLMFLWIAETVVSVGMVFTF